MSDTSVKTTCAYCGVGCGVSIPHSNDRTVQVRGDASHPANFGKLCVKGTHLGDVLPLRKRLLVPEVNGEPASWESATETIAEKIRSTLAEHGPDAFAFYLSGQLLTEDYYAANKLAKGFLGTANVDTNSRLCMSSAVAAHVRAFGEDAPPINFEDIDQAELLVLAGSNLAWAHPVLFQRRMRAQQADGRKKLVVIDPRKSASAKEAHLHLAIKPGADGQLFNALLVYLAANDGCDTAYIEQHVENFADALAAAKEDVGTDTAKQAELCGLSEPQMLEFFALFANTAKTTTAWSMGLNQTESGVDKGNALINVHLATGRIGKPGANAFSITGQPNAMGGREVGGLANQLAVHRAFDEQSIQQVGDFWQAEKMATKPGLKAVDLFDACLEGKIKVLWIMATNPVASLPNANKIREALKHVETVIVSDVIGETDTLNYAQIKLPALAWGEKDGTVTNTDRLISRQRPFLIAPGQARADWQAIADVAKKLGFTQAFNWQNSHEVFREHAQLSTINSGTPLTFNLSAVANLSFDDYQNWQPKQWPLDGKTDASRLFGNGVFATENGKANMVPVKPVTPVAGNHRFVLNTGRLRDQWHTMARTGMAATLNKHTNQLEVHLNPKDARSHGISNGDLLNIYSEQGEFYALARLEAAQNPGELFAPMHWNEHFAGKGGVGNCLASTVDPISGQPASKHSFVSFKKAEAKHNGFVFFKQDDEQPVWLKNTVWFKSYTGNGTLVKFYSDKPLAGFIDRLAEGDFDYSLHDSLSGSAQWAQFDAEGLNLWVTTSTEKCSWPEVTFLDEATHAGADNISLNSLVTGNFDNESSAGKTVCTCFGITDTQIKSYFEVQPNGTLESLQAELKCGTNCGSCLTELKEFTAELAGPGEFYNAV
ncbi:nitrate reductase [Reinekea marinisedimentorum]|uniref:Assimilatory nitrate reductase catalytic subunit n=1 Tax=Reinekea marinisedimentorum TaxID=230495 RepID=A0A4R3I2B2_9GAMM|nr:nitrate reductase [Reinekea marinisedimentorum]TCS39768.1 assimilatory nitrate reductase catalytic subunit [Reinekea marinisedimentorum]